MNIVGKIVTLRAMSIEDTKMICDMFNDPDMENLVVGWNFPKSVEQQKSWFEKNINDEKTLRLIIETPEDGAVGIATISGIDWKNRSATHGIKLANKEKRTKGIGTDTVMAVMRYAFDELGLHRLDGSWFDENTASKGLYTKCGWKEEGIRRSCVYKRGKWRDLTMVGILDSEYRETVERLHYWD